MAVAPDAIIEHVDVIRYLGLGDLTSCVDAFLDPLLLQAAKKGFGHGGSCWAPGDARGRNAATHHFRTVTLDRNESGCVWTCVAVRP